MRVHFKDTVHPARLSKTIKKQLAVHGIEMGLSKAQGVVARMFGYADWHELHKSCTQKPPCPWDHAVDPAVAAARREQYVEVLTSLGVSRETAGDIVDEASPTALRQPRSAAPDLWIVKHPDSGLADRREWAWGAEAFRSSDGFRRLHAPLMQAVTSERFWAERWAARLAVPEIKDALKTLRSNPAHELWPALAAAALAQPAQYWDESAPVDATSPQAMTSSLEAMDEEAILRLVRRLIQTVPELLAILAFGTGNGFVTVCDYPASVDFHRTGPWTRPGQLALPRVWSGEWTDLRSGDIQHFSGLQGWGTVDDYSTVVSYRTCGLDDRELRELRVQEANETEEVPSLSKMLRRENTPTDRTEIILMAVTPKGRKRVAIGYVVIRNRMIRQGAPIHAIDILHVYHVDDSAGPTLAKAATTAAITLPFQQAVEEEWPKVVPPDRPLSVRVSPDIDDQPDTTWFLDLIGSLEHVVSEGEEGDIPKVHCIDVRAEGGEPGTRPVSLPSLGSVTIPARLKADWDAFRNSFFRLAHTVKGPALVLIDPADGPRVLFGYPYEEDCASSVIARTAARDRRYDGWEREEKAYRDIVAEIEGGRYERLFTHLLRKRESAVLTQMGMFGPAALFDGDTWYGERWHEHRLGIDLIWYLNGKPSAETRRMEEDGFWRYFPMHLRDLLKRRTLAAEGIPADEDWW